MHLLNVVSPPPKVVDKLFLANLWWVALFMMTNDQIMPRIESFTNAFFSNLNTLNLKIFPNHDGIFT